VDMNQLETFRKVASVSSFTQAAVQLRYAQSTVTAHIKALESEFNTALFERYGRGVQITAAGKQLLPFIDRILSLLSQAHYELADEREPRGLLTIGAPESVATYRLPPLLELFRYRYPRVRLSMRPMPVSDIRRALRDRALDVAFLVEDKRKLPGLASADVCPEPLTLVAAPDHCLAAEQQLDAAHLRTTDLLGTEPGCAYRDKMVEWLNRTDTDPVPVLEFGTIEAIKRTVQARLGVALLPTVTVADELALGSLVELPWKAPFQVYTRLVWDEAKWVSPELELFISEATRVMREEADSACAVA
jgi:DNA-binding transcriptional LysR family regulator